MKKRLFALILACALLTGCGAERTEPAAVEPEADGEVIAYVPLDDRPDNVGRVVYLAESLGYMLEMPDADLYRTRLDHQPVNSNGLQYGDRAALYAWVRAQEAAGCDRYVISLDQLLSGGLVSSRHMTGENPVVVEEGSQTQTVPEAELLRRVLEELGADENNRVWLLDSVMRLAPTVGYNGLGLNEYNALRSYGMAPRPTLSGSELTVHTIIKDYPLDASGVPLAVESDEPLPEGALEDYLASRSRKLRLTDALFDHLSEDGDPGFRVLIGIDDSSEEDSIQKNEIAYLRSRLRTGDALLSGVDDLAFKAVARLYLEDRGAAAELPRVLVSYYGGTEERPACAYDYKALTAIVDEHMEFFGLKQAADAAEADLHMLVLTQPADETKKTDYCNELIRQLNRDRKERLPVILIDAGNGRYGTAFHEALTEKAELGWLLSYAGFLDMAIVTGTAMSHGVARYVFLQTGEQTEMTERAFARTLADSVLKDFCYKNIVRNDILSYVRGDLAGNADNYWNPDIDRTAVLRRLESGMTAAAAPVADNLEHSNFISALEPYTERGWGGIALEDYCFPWDRAFEIDMQIRLGAFTEPHEEVLGIYYR